MDSRRGFSLIELIIVIAIIGIMATISAYAYQSYVNNTNLRTAARDMVSDFQNCKGKAISESRDYQISFTTGTNSSYTISASATTNHAAVSTTKSPTAFGNGIQIIVEDTCNGFFGTSAANIIRFQARGTSANGCVKLTNTRGSKATITTNVTGRTHVAFAIQ